MKCYDVAAHVNGDRSDIQEATGEAIQQAKLYQGIAVTNETENISAAGALSNVRGTLKKLEETRESLVKPLNDHVKFINSQFKPALTALKECDGKISGLLSQYHMQIEEERRKEEARLQTLADARAVRAEAAGRPAPTALAPTVAEQPRAIQTDDGKVTFTEHKTWEVENIKEVPLEYLMPDRAKITKVVNAGVEIPGIKVIVEKIPVVR